jgi:hypothetical protein
VHLFGMPGAGRRRAVMSISCRDEIGIVTPPRPTAWLAISDSNVDERTENSSL